MTEKDKGIFEDRKAIIAALVAWFQSQEIPAAHAVPIMATMVGLAIHQAAKGDARKLTDGFEKAVHLVAAVAVSGEA